MVYLVGMLLVLMCVGAFWSRARVRTERPVSTVQVDARGVGRGSEAVSWQDLVQIDIVTTDAGPFAEDVFWLFTAHDGTGCALPGSAVGDALFARLQRLEGVDFGAVVSAMGSTENASFRVWHGERGAARPAAQEPAVG